MVCSLTFSITSFFGLKSRKMQVQPACHKLEDHFSGHPKFDAGIRNTFKQRYHHFSERIYQFSRYVFAAANDRRRKCILIMLTEHCAHCGCDLLVRDRPPSLFQRRINGMHILRDSLQRALPSQKGHYLIIRNLGRVAVRREKAAKAGLFFAAPAVVLCVGHRRDSLSCHIIPCNGGEHIGKHIDYVHILPKQITVELPHRAWRRNIQVRQRPPRRAQLIIVWLKVSPGDLSREYRLRSV